MVLETLKMNQPHSKNSRSSGCTLLGFNLPSLIATMKHSDTWANGELNALVLLKSPKKQIILTAMHEGTEIESFQSNESITFQIIEGRLKFHIRKDTLTLNEGQLMTLDENINYRLSSQEETVFLLTISDTIAKAPANF
jgi:quercetin dioxygenase-like cupin family protein